MILTERPTALHRDAEGRLHHPDGPAIAYADGWSLYAVHGVRVPERVIQNAYTAADITAENNAEVRRVMLERYGEARYIEELGATPVDTSDWGTLYQVEQPEDEPLTMVAVWNSTPEPDGTFKRYWLPCPPGMPAAPAERRTGEQTAADRAQRRGVEFRADGQELRNGERL